jgi:hypothetical protein
MQIQAHQEQNQRPDGQEQTEQGRETSGLENENPKASAADTDDNQNDLAGNASGNTPDQPAGNIPSETGGTDSSGDNPADWQNDSLPSDGPVSQEEGHDRNDLTNIETDHDDELGITD